MLRFRRVRPPLTGFAVAVMLGSLLAVSTAEPATAQTQCGTDGATQPVLSVDRPVLPANGSTTVTVTGANYLVPKTAWNAATNRCNDVRGGVYVFFGWVNPAGNWGPSTRHIAQGAGKFGTGYTYPGESGGAETREVAADVPIRFVSFSQGGESGSSTPFHMDGSGNWSTQLSVSGSTYTWRLEGSGGSGSVDCRAVQCGIFTIGAHGIVSPTNEVFTPISFTAPAGAASAGGGVGGGSPAPAPAAAGGSDGSSGATGSGGATGGGGSAGEPGSTGGPEGASGGQSATTLAADTPVDPNTSTTEAGSTGSKTTTVDGERASSLQDFSDDGSSSSAPLLGVLFGLLIAGGIVAVVMVRRRNKGTNGRGEPSAPAAG